MIQYFSLQIQGEGAPLVAVNNGGALLVRGAPAAAQYNGLVGTIITIARQEGPRYVPIAFHLVICLVFFFGSFYFWHYFGEGTFCAGIGTAYNFRSLYNGLSAGLQRQMCFASVRLGLYDSVKTLYQQLLDSTG